MSKISKIDIKQTSICGDLVSAFRCIGDNKIYASFVEICNHLGIDFQTQRDKLITDEVLSKGVQRFVVPQPNTPPRMTLCIDITYIPLWLAGINTNKVKASSRDKLIAYKERAKDILAKAFMPRFPEYNIPDHCKKEVQIQNSKDVNTYHFFEGGVEEVKDYNATNCKVHTGKYPREWKAIAKKDGLPAKKRSSGKEVVRQYMPAQACAMSFADSMVKFGLSAKKALSMSAKYNMAGLYQEMINEGFIPGELHKGPIVQQ